MPSETRWARDAEAEESHLLIYLAFRAEAQDCRPACEGLLVPSVVNLYGK